MDNNKNVVYIIKNDFNDKVYVGVTNNLKRRMYQHSIGKDAEHSPIDRSILIHGWCHFYYEVLDHYTDLEDRRTKEIYYIRLYNSYHNGYNANEGGDVIVSIDTRGEKNPRAQITEQDVIDIRKRRMNGERLDSVYEDYKDKMPGGKRSGFSKV
jgi:group I intron endonuclease